MIRMSYILFLAFTTAYDKTISDPASIPWLLSDRVSSWEGSNSQRAWRYLRISLETHDLAEQDFVYRKVTFQKILDLEVSSRVPAWLVKFFEVRSF